MADKELKGWTQLQQTTDFVTSSAVIVWLFKDYTVCHELKPTAYIVAEV